MEQSDTTSARGEAILEAATGVFLRYGFRKTSMDDLARAAGMSRQGLYLHFATKEALFEAALHQLIRRIRAASRAALTMEARPVEERLLGAFLAFHAQMIGPNSAHLNELMEAAQQIIGPIGRELEDEFLADVTRVLKSAGLAANWKGEGLSAKDLAEHLVAASTGLKHTATTVAEYERRMRVAIRILSSS